LFTNQKKIQSQNRQQTQILKNIISHKQLDRESLNKDQTLNLIKAIESLDVTLYLIINLL
jgi:hypothetical protein